MVLLWKAKKYGHAMVWLATTPSDRQHAVMALFKAYDQCGFYNCVELADHVDWLNRARKGDVDAARELLEDRWSAGYEYEDDWDLIELVSWP